MARKKIMFGVGAGMVSLAVDGIAALVTFGLLLRYLPATDAGYWSVIITAGSFLLMLQCGLGPTIAREVSQTLVTENAASLPALLGAIKTAFRHVALLIAVVATALYVFYLRRAASDSHLGPKAALAWFLYASGLAMNLQGQGRLFIMDGFGEVGWEKVFRIFFSSFGLAATWGAFLMGADIVALAVIFAIQNAMFWIAAVIKVKSALPLTRVTAIPASGQVKKLFLDGGKILYLNLTYYAVTYSGIFVVQSHFGLAQVAPFTATLKVSLLLSAVSLLLPQMLYPYVSSAWASSNFALCRKYYFFGVAGAVGVYILLALPVFLLRKPLFTLWLGKSGYPGTATLAVLLLYQLIYVHHGAHASPVLATTGRAFILPATLCALATPPLVVFMAGQIGMPGIPAGMILGVIPATAIVVLKSWMHMTRAVRPAEMELATT